MLASRLGSIPLFADLPAGELDAAAASASELEVAVGEAVASEGEFGHALFAIESGAAEVLNRGELLATLGPGDVFGEIAVLASGRRTATVVATEPLRLIAIFKREVWALEQASPEFAQRLRALMADRRAPTA